MKAVWYERNGPAREVLQCGDLSDPVPGTGEVLVRVHASGVNPSDWKTRSGYGPDEAETHEPPALYHLGLDPGEQFDVAKDHPDVIAELEHEAERHRATLAPVETNLDAVLPEASR